MLFINQNFDLMKKAKFSLVLTGVMFFLFVGVQGVNAQSFQIDEGDALTVKDMDVDGVDLVVNGEAIVILNAAIKSLDAGNTVVEEANAAARQSYYEFLLTELEQGASVDALLPTTGYDLYMIVSRFQESMGLDQQEIYDETVQLLIN